MNSNYNIFKRIIFLIIIKFIIIFILIFVIFKISTDKKLESVSNNKNFYKLKIKNSRGNIYDCRGISLLNTRKKFLAAIIPDKNNFIKIINFVPESQKSNFIQNFFKNQPFISEVSSNLKIKNIKIFEILEQVFNSNFLCHIIGYLNNGHGVCGIEKSFDKFLNSFKDIEIEYQKNALGQIVAKEQKYDFYDKSYQNSYGVQLCIDKRIQEIVEETAKKYISKGAVLVTEIPNCKIRASLSLPDFNPAKIKNFLDSKDSNFLNRVNCAYNLGSIFKLVTAARLIESGVNIYEIYNCSGSVNFDNNTKIKCFNGISHGKINLEDAVALSCNTMFVELSKKINPEFFIKTARNLGFGKKIELAPEFFSESGNLPSITELKNNKKMAMFSFGQESLMATPMQVAALINTIACEGIYHEPKLIENLINKDGSFEKYNFKLPKRVLKSHTARNLKKFMRKSIILGTAKYANSKKITAAAKTSTAETGIFINNNRVNQSWIAGFFPFENPKYSIIILAENINLGGKICGPVFKEIAEKISKI